MIRDILYIVLGYLTGSVLFARVFGTLICKKDITENSKDHNPGTANAYRNGGFWCGTLTLLGDLLKGFLPVYLYLRGTPSVALALVIAAPVLGHIFSVFHNFSGGKGIATAFGSLLGLMPNWIPAVTLAAFFIFFSVAVRIDPHYFRTIFAFVCTEAALFFLPVSPRVLIGFTVICGAVCWRLYASDEEKEPVKVVPLWKR